MQDHRSSVKDVSLVVGTSMECLMEMGEIASQMWKSTQMWKFLRSGYRRRSVKKLLKIRNAMVSFCKILNLHLNKYNKIYTYSNYLSWPNKPKEGGEELYERKHFRIKMSVLMWSRSSDTPAWKCHGQLLHHRRKMVIAPTLL